MIGKFKLLEACGGHPGMDSCMTAAEHFSMQSALRNREYLAQQIRKMNSWLQSEAKPPLVI